MRRYGMLFLVLMLAVLLTGCAVGAEELYALPSRSEQYTHLQELIDEKLSEGAEYAAPTGGDNRQSVQLADVTGDDVPEALVFLANEDRCPMVCIYRQDAEGAYYLSILINGEGSAVSSVDYADLTGDGVPEFIVVWQVGGDLRLLSAYDLSGENPRSVLNVDCGIFVVCDLTGDGVSEIADLRLNDNGDDYLVLYQIAEDMTVSSCMAKLSEGTDEILRVRSGRLRDGAPALYVESRWGKESLITDVFSVREEGIGNITLLSSGHSGTVRSGELYATDINGDGVLELPAEEGDLIRWYELGTGGERVVTSVTLHDYDDGWYLDLTGWETEGLTVEMSQTLEGEKKATLSRNGERLLTVYTLTGENRTDRAAEEGRFSLASRGSTAYAAELYTGDVTEKELTELFHLIYAEWQTGAV